MFDITDPTKRLKISLLDQNERLVFEMDIDLEEYRDYRTMGSDILIYGDYQDNDEPDEEGPRLRVRLHYNYSDKERYRTMLEEWHQDIINNLADYRQVSEFLDNMQTPFGFLQAHANAGKQNQELDEIDIEEMNEQKRGDTPFHK